MAIYAENNPVQWVGSKKLAIPVPSSFQWDAEDISSSDAGRTEDTVMHKNKIGECRSLTLAWAYLTTEEISTILQAFDSEYLDICYLDPKKGAYRTSNFYVGNRTAPLYNANLGRWTKLSFKVIETSGVNDD